MNDTNDWWVYILECNDGTFYTGITNDVEQRVHQHNHGNAAAKYTRARRPVKLIYSENVADKSTALKREYEIKKLRREKKYELIYSTGK